MQDRETWCAGGPAKKHRQECMSSSRWWNQGYNAGKVAAATWGRGTLEWGLGRPEMHSAWKQSSTQWVSPAAWGALGPQHYQILTAGSGSSSACGQSCQNLFISKCNRASVTSLQTPAMCWIWTWMSCHMVRSVKVRTKAIMVLLQVEALAMMWTTGMLLQWKSKCFPFNQGPQRAKAMVTAYSLCQLILICWSLNTCWGKVPWHHCPWK